MYVCSSVFFTDPKTQFEKTKKTPKKPHLWKSTFKPL